MPELPEVENVVRSLEPKLRDRIITTVDLYTNTIHSLIQYNNLEDFIKRLENMRIVGMIRRGKFMMIGVESYGEEEHFIVHLGMTGTLIHREDTDYSSYPDSIKNHIHAEIFLDNGSVLFYSDYRRFGSLRIVSTQELHDPTIKHLKLLQSLGPEPFQDDVKELFLSNIRKKKYQNKSIKDVLLDQTVIAGAGNIYASECLFPARINPLNSVEVFSDDQLLDVLRHLTSILELSIKLGGSSIKDYVNGEGASGSFQDFLKVYDQDVCQDCGTSITKTFIKNRSTYFCPSCQPLVPEDIPRVKYAL